MGVRGGPRLWPTRTVKGNDLVLWFDYISPGVVGMVTMPDRHNRRESTVTWDSDQWPPARLISATGIRSGKEQEQRATAALLSVVSLVPEFGKRILRYASAPSGNISTFTEPTFRSDAGGTLRPDGAILVHRGKTDWGCLVEVKTGSSDLAGEQIEDYLRLAASEGFDALITISNEIVSSPEESPVKVRRTLLKKVRLIHLSWFRILTEAIIELEHHGVEDREQHIALADLIVYLDDERSGAVSYTGMGKDWVQVRDSARNRTLRSSDDGVKAIADDWEEFTEYLALRLRQRLGRPVTPSFGGSGTRANRLGEHSKELGSRGTLHATLKVRDAAGPLELEADLGARQVTVSMQVSAPKEGWAKTRVNWMLRQLRDAPDDLRITVKFARTRATTSALLSAAREDVSVLLLPEDPKREPTAFSLALTSDMGTKRGTGNGSFVAETQAQMLTFYGEVVQHVQKWAPKAPKLSETAESESPLGGSVLAKNSPPPSLLGSNEETTDERVEESRAGFDGNGHGGLSSDTTRHR